MQKVNLFDYDIVCKYYNIHGMESNIFKISDDIRRLNMYSECVTGWDPGRATTSGTQDKISQFQGMDL